MKPTILPTPIPNSSRKRKKTRKKRLKIRLFTKKQGVLFKIDIRPEPNKGAKQHSILKSLFNNQNINIIQNVINPNYLQVVEKIPNFPKMHGKENRSPGAKDKKYVHILDRALHLKSGRKMHKK